MNIREKINNHWTYIELLLQAHNEDKEVIRKIEFHYKTAMQHGWKHCSEDIKKIVELNEGKEPFNTLMLIADYLNKH